MKIEQIRLENDISDMILEVARLYPDVTNSDLQGVALATAKKIIDRLSK